MQSDSYCDFFSGSLVASEDDDGGVLEPEELLPPLGGVLLAPEELLLLGELLDEDGLELAPPEAEPELDFEGSVALGELDELPPEGEVAEDELEPELGGVDDALPLVLPLVLPLLPVVLPVPLS